MSTLLETASMHRGALALEQLLARRRLSILRTTCLWGSVMSAGVALVFIYGYNDLLYGISFSGISFILGAGWLEQILLYSYHNSHFFHGLNSIIGLNTKPCPGTTYEAAKVVLTNPDDLSRSFVTSPLGTLVILRAGIPLAAIDSFVRTPRTMKRASEIVVADDELFTLITLGTYLLSHDAAFKSLIQKAGVDTQTYLAALTFVIGSHHHAKRALRWWSKDQLSRHEGIGREWSYGTTYLLETFSRPIQTSALFSVLTSHNEYAIEKLDAIETALASTRAANVLIVGEPGVGKMDLVMELKRRLAQGVALTSIAKKRVIVLDTNRLFSSYRAGPDLAHMLMSLFEEARAAGNVIIVIENLSTVVKEARARDVFLPELLDEYLASPTLHIIATDTPGGFHSTLVPLRGLVHHFSEVLVEPPPRDATVRVLESVVAAYEHRHQTFFTYPALLAVASAADRYLTQGVMPEKAINLLARVAAAAQPHQTITPDEVYQLVREETGIPVGPVGEEERDVLLHLEDQLHLFVVGQEPALSSIARTMRRARAGIQASDKPIGSFLFLGPTGVGKTETAKALAHIFFGSETQMHRFDMSEFSDPFALVRLIGDADEPGALTTALLNHPYAVVLLDEFEKASDDVHDLFLQILDEGVFRNGRGEQVNARNTIIVATSNAGSDLIMRTVQQRKALAYLSQEIITHIIKTGVFRPELINRFDSTIIFEPLFEREQKQVASLLLTGLTERMNEKGITLVVTDDLLSLLVTHGYHPEFGARPMRRILQDVLEEKIATKIIAGEVKAGDTLTLSRADFSDAELAVIG